MRINDFLNISEHIKEYVLKSCDDYIKLLGVIGNNHRYRFIDQLSIFDRRPKIRVVQSKKKSMSLSEDYKLNQDDKFEMGISLAVNTVD